MSSIFRRSVTICGALVVVLFLAYEGFFWAAEWRRANSERERASEDLIREVSKDEAAYYALWQNLVEKHGTQDAALRHLRKWAEAKVNYLAAMEEWKAGRAPLPEEPDCLFEYTVEEADELIKSGVGVTVGCCVAFDDGFTATVIAGR